MKPETQSILALTSPSPILHFLNADWIGLWEHMGWTARTIAIILFIESIWVIDRYLLVTSV